MRLSTWLFAAVTIVTLGHVVAVLSQQFFGFDHWEYARNGLSLGQLSPENYGYDPSRPLLPSLLGALLSWLPKPWPYMRALQLCAVACGPLLLWTIRGILLDTGQPVARSNMIVGVLGLSGLLAASSLAITDVPGALFVTLALAQWIRWRDTHPSRALLGAALFWILAGLTRHNHMAFGAVFAIDDVVRLMSGRERVCTPARVILWLVAPLVQFAAFAAPFLFHAEGLWVGLSSQLTANSNTFSDLDRGFLWDRVLLFALGLPLLSVAAVGAWRGLVHVRRNAIVRLMGIHVLLWIVLHGAMVPQQYVRFLMPLMVPLALCLAWALAPLSSRRSAWVCGLLALSVLTGLGEVASWMAAPGWRRPDTRRVSEALAAGRRTIWIGKSYPAPFGERDDVGPSSNFTLSHYGYSAVRVARGSPIIVRSKATDPLSWVMDARTGDRIFHNSNSTIFYRDPQRGRGALPATVYTVTDGRNPTADERVFSLCREASGRLWVREGEVWTSLHSGAQSFSAMRGERRKSQVSGTAFQVGFRPLLTLSANP